MQQQTVQQLAETAEKGGSIVAFLSGSMAFLNENAAAIGAMCALGGLLVALAGFVVNWHYQSKRTKIEEKKL